MDTYGGMAETPVPSIFLEQHLYKDLQNARHFPDHFTCIISFNSPN